MRLETLESIFNLDGKDLIVLPFKSYLLEIMNLYPEDKDHLNQIPGYRDYLDDATKQGYGFTVLDKGRPIVCFGVVPLWPGVAELWLIPDTKLIQKWKLKFHKGARKFMELAADELNLHRLHVTVSAQNVRSVKWIEHIYFKREGLLKKYSFNKKDMIMYSRLFEK
tara:strand:- start:216 stop:713 length:498 start_codon:yes stop_codon:yes gene_type:complete